MASGNGVPVAKPLQERPPRPLTFTGDLDKNGLKRDPQARGKVSNQASQSTARPVKQSDLPGSKERWIPTPSHQLETTERMGNETEVQDGRLKSSEGRLDGLHRFERCLLISTGAARAQEIPSVCVEKDDIRVPVPTLRLEQCSQSIHKTAETSDGPPQETRHPKSNIPGRHATDDRVKGTTGATDTGGSGASQATGSQDKLGEITSCPYASDHLSGDS